MIIVLSMKTRQNWLAELWWGAIMLGPVGLACILKSKLIISCRWIWQIGGRFFVSKAIWIPLLGMITQRCGFHPYGGTFGKIEWSPFLNKLLNPPKIIGLVRRVLEGATIFPKNITKKEKSILKWYPMMRILWSTPMQLLYLYLVPGKWLLIMLLF